MGQLFSSSTDEHHKDLAFTFTDYFKKFKAETKIIPQETIDSIKLSLTQGNIQGANSSITDALKKIDSTPLNVAVTGESGAGKSAFINSLRGVGHEDEDAAEVGVVETTMKRHKYKHANIPNVSFWDLPGIGTTNFPPKDYLEEMKFHEYDFFIIVSATRFKKNDIDLAKAISMMKKDFYFVRTKVDSDLNNEKKFKPRTFNRENLLQQIRTKCVKTFQDNHIEEPPIFLISNRYLSDYDFPILMDKVMNALPVHKRHVFMLSLPNLTGTAIERKQQSLKQRIWLEAFASDLLSIIPSLTLFMDSDVENLEKSLNFYRTVFGVDDASLQSLAKDWGMSVDQLKAKMKSPNVFETTKKEILQERLSRYYEEFCLELYYLKLYFVDMVTDDANSSREHCWTAIHLPQTPATYLFLHFFTDYFKKFKAENKIIPQETIASIELSLKNRNIQGANSSITDALKEIDSTPLNVAVTGESGAGKSTLINALRGVGHEEKNAAEIGVVETTMKRHPYKHPNIPNVVIWDLPGIGTTNFPPKDYLEKMKFHEYDFFIIVSATRFKKNDVDLAKAISMMKKDFYFVRTKVDSDLNNEKEFKPRTFNRETVLQQIRTSCVKTFQENNIDEPPIFLISNRYLSDYDFPILMDKVMSVLPVYKRHIFMLSLPNITGAAIERKRQFLMQRIWLEAFTTDLLSTIPSLAHLLMDSDVENLEKSLNFCRTVFGVDDASLQSLAKDWGMSVDQLKAKMKSPNVFETTKKETIQERLSRYYEEFCLAHGHLFNKNVYVKKLYYLKLCFVDMVTDDANALLKEICSRNNLVSD
uniref:IRG-type G domain-containing protein n=1 Tax=Peromyscus maniculatus bairdii TaxID=230844 RepID=A0A8C8U8F2_PERMB